LAIRLPTAGKPWEERGGQLRWTGWSIFVPRYYFVLPWGRWPSGRRRTCYCPSVLCPSVPLSEGVPVWGGWIKHKQKLLSTSALTATFSKGGQKTPYSRHRITIYLRAAPLFSLLVKSIAKVANIYIITISYDII